jgi:hypothetical protein
MNKKVIIIIVIVVIAIVIYYFINKTQVVSGTVIDSRLPIVPVDNTPDRTAIQDTPVTTRVRDITIPANQVAVTPTIVIPDNVVVNPRVNPVTDSRVNTSVNTRTSTPVIEVPANQVKTTPVFVPPPTGIPGTTMSSNGRIYDDETGDYI